MLFVDPLNAQHHLKAYVLVSAIKNKENVHIEWKRLVYLYRNQMDESVQRLDTDLLFQNVQNQIKGNPNRQHEKLLSGNRKSLIRG